MTLSHTFAADNNTVFVGGTAYNFLNAFFRPPSGLRPSTSELSANTIHRLGCANSRDALVVYALLSSRIAFWLWCVLGDGFHVGRGFLETVPLGSSLFDDDQLNRLGALGHELWQKTKHIPVESSNRGRASLSFPASRAPVEQGEVDKIISDGAELPADFLGAIRNFIDGVIAADPSQQFNVCQTQRNLIDEDA
jgi:hypothetical protein